MFTGVKLHWWSRVLVLAAASAPGITHAADIVISDGTFNTWKFASYVAGSGNPTAMMKVDNGGGNPAPELVNTTAAGDGGTAGGYGYDVGTPVNADLTGAKFVLTVQMKSGAGDLGAGQDIHLLVSQNGASFISYWHKHAGEVRGKWRTFTLHGRLSEGFFIALQGGASAPNFKDPAITTHFGLYAENSQTSRKVKDFFDNFSLTIMPKP